MLHHLKLLTGILTFGILCACASNPPTPFQYKNTDSRALNYVRAAGMSAKLEDMVVPKDTVNNITDTSAFAMSSAIAAYNAPIPGFSGDKMAGLNLVSWFLLPEAAAARNSIFAWMPADLSQGDPEDAVKVMADILFEAGIKAALEMNFNPKGVQDDNRRNNVVAFRDVKGIEKCKNTEVYATCIVNFGVRNPVKLPSSPPFLADNGASWFFNPVEKYLSSFFGFPRDNKGVNELEFLVKTSAHLPDWIYFYVAPRQVFINEKDTVKVPLVINQGAVNYFIKPDQS